MWRDGKVTDTWLSVAEGATVPGGPVSGVVVDDQLSLFLADPQGGVVSAAGRPDHWGGWGPVSDGATVPGGRVSAVRDEGGLICVFLADPDGNVVTCRGSGPGWTGWSTVGAAASRSRPSALAGAPVTAVADPDGQVSLFLTDPAGRVVTCRGLGTTWSGWSSVAGGSALPGAPVTAVSDPGGQLSISVTDPAGRVLTCRGLGTGWTAWSSVAQGSSTPGGHVTAYVGADGVVNLFVADPGGAVVTCRGLGTGWTAWASVARGVSAPGGVVSTFPAQTLAAEQLGVVLADSDGAVHLTTGLADTWDLWRPVAEGATRPGAPITAVRLRGRVHATVPLSRDPTVTVLVMADVHGAVHATQLAV